MKETGWFLTEGGSVLEMDLPLPESIEQRVTQGHITRVNPDGSEYGSSTVEPVKPAHKPRATKKPEGE